jgi:hypothetical protein
VNLSFSRQNVSYYLEKGQLIVIVEGFSKASKILTLLCRCSCPKPQCIFWPIFVRFRVKLKIELFKKPIDILNYNAHRAHSGTSSSTQPDIIIFWKKKLVLNTNFNLSDDVLKEKNN